MPTSVQEIYKLSRDILGREPDSPENITNYLNSQDLDRSEIVAQMRQDIPASPEEKERFFGELGFDYDRSQILNDSVQMTADLAEAYINSQNQALADLGVFEFDEEAVEKEVLDYLQPYFQEQHDVLDREVREGKIENREDYEFRKQQIEDQATERLREISITEAETDEELQNKLTNVGASTQFNLSQARRAWEKRIQKSVTTQAKGRGFSGVMKEEIANLRTAREEELTEIGRRGGVSEQTVQRTAKYTKERARAAREATTAFQQREGGRAEVLRGRGERAFGTEEEPGFIEQERGTELIRSQETLKLQEIEQRRREAREEAGMAQQLALKQAEFPDYEEFLRKQKQRATL